MDIKTIVGKRCLLKLTTASYRFGDVTEYRVLEISPSGNWLKLQNLNGNKFWKPIQEVAFVETLIDLKNEKGE